MADNKFTHNHVEGDGHHIRMSAETPGQNLKEKSEALVDAEALDKQADFIPTPEDQIDALGIPEWRTLEKKIVRRLDMTLMPCLWTLYLFNYLDRASIAQARINTLEEDLNLGPDHYNTAVMILSLGYASLQNEAVTRLTQTQLCTRTNSQQHDHRVPQAFTLPLFDGYRVVRCLGGNVWNYRLQRSCARTLLPRSRRSASTSWSGISHGMLVHPS